MLTRPPNDPDAKREKRRIAQREYRRRYDAGRWIEPVEVDNDVVEMLIATGWLKPDGKVADAIGRMLREAAKA